MSTGYYLPRPLLFRIRKYPYRDTRPYRETGLVEVINIVGKVGILEKEGRKSVEVGGYYRIARSYYTCRLEVAAYTLPLSRDIESVAYQSNSYRVEESEG